MKLAKGKNTKPHPLRKSGKKAAKLEKRRLEAKQRQAEYDALTPTQQAAQREFYRQRYLAS